MPNDPSRASAFLLGFWLALLIFAPFAPPAFGDPANPPPRTEIAALERALEAAVNRVRAEKHRVPLERRSDLDAVARGHSRDMARRRYLSHTSPEGSDWVDRLGRHGVSGFALAGENVGLTSRADPAGEILRGWLASPVHRQNLLAAPYNATGIGVARARDGTLYFTQLYLTFPRPAHEVAADPGAPGS